MHFSPLPQVNFPVCLAPMVGLSHAVLRRVVRSYLPKDAVTIWPTEMLNSRRLPSERLGETPETYRLKNEDLMVPQILGNEEKFIADSLKKLELWGISGIDINMGCPVKKALQHNYGVALMGDPQYAAEVVAMTSRNTSRPIGVKLRAAKKETNQVSDDFLLKFVEGIVNAGASWITLHPRTAEQKRKGYADWNQIRSLKQNFDVPIIGNGDVQTFQDVIDMKEQTDCDMVMVGRALTARPWMLWQLGKIWGFENPEGRIGNPPQTPEEEAKEYGRTLIDLLCAFEEFFSEPLGIRKFKFHVRVSAVWLDWGHSLQSKISKCETYLECKSVVYSFFENPNLRLSQKTDLRY